MSCDRHLPGCGGSNARGFRHPETVTVGNGAGSFCAGTQHGPNRGPGNGGYRATACGHLKTFDGAPASGETVAGRWRSRDGGLHPGGVVGRLGRIGGGGLPVGGAARSSPHSCRVGYGSFLRMHDFAAVVSPGLGVFSPPARRGVVGARVAHRGQAPLSLARCAARSCAAVYW